MDELLNSADIGFMLMGNNIRVCGAAYKGVDSRPYGIGNHACARGFYTFGHEVGHIFGADHDRANAFPGSSDDTAFGWLIEPKGDKYYNGFRTNMA